MLSPINTLVSDKPSNNTLRDNAMPPKRVSSKRTQRLGYLVFDGQNSAVPCAVRDFSDKGATLAASGWMGLPERFTLFVEPDCVRVTCRVNTRHGSMVKVSFESWEEAATMRRR